MQIKIEYLGDQYEDKLEITQLFKHTEAYLALSELKDFFYRLYNDKGGAYHNLHEKLRCQLDEKTFDDLIDAFNKITAPVDDLL